jgi:hypothetical protein
MQKVAVRHDRKTLEISSPRAASDDFVLILTDLGPTCRGTLVTP